MKKIACLFLAMLLCLSVVAPVFAAEDTFTPSVPYKDTPEIVPVPDPEGNDAIGVIEDENGNILDYVYADCLIITSVAEAETSTEIPEASRELLLSVYQQLLDDTMQIDYSKFNANLDPEYMVIRDLFDATFICEEHPEMLEPQGVVLKITFDLGIKDDVFVFSSIYKNGDWNPIVSTVNNGDGTITCTFENLCPIAFSVQTERGPAQTDDGLISATWPWVLLFVVSACTLVGLAIVRRKNA